MEETVITYKEELDNCLKELKELDYEIYNENDPEFILIKENHENEIKEIKLKIKSLKLLIRENEEMETDKEKIILPKDRRIYKDEVPTIRSRSGYVTNQNILNKIITNHSKISK